MNDREHELLAMPTLAAQLPHRFDNGFAVDSFGSVCNKCRNPIPPANIHGALTCPVPDMLVIEAVAVCLPCRVGTPLLLRLKADGQFTTLAGSQWRSGQVPLPRAIRLKQWWAQLLGRLRSCWQA